MSALGQAEGPPGSAPCLGAKGDAYSIAAWLLTAGINALDKDDQLFNQQHGISTQTPLNPDCMCLQNNL